MERFNRTLQFHFATLPAIGGVLLASGEVGFILPAVAVIASLLGFLLVDRWKLFFLPNVAAYVGMGGVALYSMADFIFLHPNSQLMAVAQLLVYVLVILNFQQKTIRVFEQIGIFCLLELIVAAVFNSALLFGIMLFPFSVVGLRAMVLLQALSTMQASEAKSHDLVQVSANDSIRSLAKRSARLPRYGIAVLAPSVVVVAAMFFYGLPRAGGTADAARIGGRVTTGFTEILTLDQVGKLHDNPELVMRLTLSHLRTGRVFRSRQSIYLRGQALENYDVNGGTGVWQSAITHPRSLSSLLPQPFVDNSIPVDELDHDEVLVYTEMQPLTSEALFSIAPYYVSHHYDNIEHLAGKWLLRRRDEGSLRKRERLAFRYATNAFRNGIQTPYIRYFASGEGGFRNLYRHITSGSLPNDPFGFDPQLSRHMLQFDKQTMPAVAEEAKLVVDAIGDREKSKYQVCKAIERHLASSGRFKYSKDLIEERDRRVDPIEEFVAKYRKGHCQYFAAAMVMMLRSQGIPARIVVGYRTDEFNNIAGHYLVRQSHAHAWVEALLTDADLNDETSISGQPKFGPVLVRFDPTPGESNVHTLPTFRSNHFYDFAQSLWNSYVLDMNRERQEETLFGQSDAAGISSAYSRMIMQMQIYASRVSTGEAGAGDWALSNLFSWRAAVAGIALTLICFGFYQIGLPRWLSRKLSQNDPSGQKTATSAVDFFRRLCTLLEQSGFRRASGQTPAEFALKVNAATSSQTSQLAMHQNASLFSQALTTLVNRFYQVRFGRQNTLSPSEQTEVEQALRIVASHLQQDNLSQTNPSPPQAT
jgi:hypothetical protein